MIRLETVLGFFIDVSRFLGFRFYFLFFWKKKIQVKGMVHIS